MPKSLFFKAAATTGLLLCLSFSAYPHGTGGAEPHRVRDPLELAPAAPAVGAALERLTGEIHHVTIDDRVAGVVVEHYALKLDNGTAVALKNVATQGLATGDRVEAMGRRNGKALFASGVKTLRPGPGHGVNQKAKGGASVDGTLALLHADQFDTGRSDFIFEVHDAQGNAQRLDFAALPEALQSGMRVAVTGTVAADGIGVVPDTVSILALPADTTASSRTVAKALKTNNVLVILMTFTDSAPVPFSQAQVQSVVAGGPGSGSVSEYFKEVSYGQQLMNATITSWLPTNAATPANCNWQTMGSLGRTAAANAGYTVANYQNLVYVFPQVSACGWIGLGYIGGNGVWINGRNATQAYSHELGHNFGLLHAGSLRCSAGSIGGTCTVTEYGDPFDVMGNISAMHFNAAQKLDLGWIAPSTVQTHGSGTRTYTLSPLETAGGATYAVKIPAAANRTYWLEYRQPIGFDGGMSSYPNNGAQVRVASPFETMCSGCDIYSNDTQLVDMTPGTSEFTDAALIVGNTYTDATYNVTFTVSAATSGSLTLQVTTPSSMVSSTTAVASSANPATAGASVTFTATITGSAPTGTVSFTADSAAISGCSAVALSGAGNTRTATCSTSTLAAGTHSIVASYGGDGANSGSTSATLSQVVNAVVTAGWIDDSVPAGAATGADGETWKWISSSPTPFSGSLAHQSAIAAGMHQHYFYGASPAMTPGTGDILYAYVYLDPVNPPSEVMLQWNDGNWEHRAYWGANLIGAGTNGTVSRQFMGALPATGQWIKLAVPAASVGLEGHAINGMAFTLYGGRATWDQAGKTAGANAVWIDDATPAGATGGGDGDAWNWVTASPAPFSGTVAHQSALAAGMHQHYFWGATTKLTPSVGDSLYAYVYIDPLNPPSEIMLQWNDGSWEHRAYWGANLIGAGTNGTVSRQFMGALPAAGQWVKLTVPAASVGLEGHVVNGMAFTLSGGRATWDQAGKTTGATNSVWVEDSVPAGAGTAGDGEGWNWVGPTPAPFSGTVAHQSTLAAGMHQHYFYGASATLSVAVGDTLYAYVYLDAQNPPTEVMLQWADSTWEHRAYWGANAIAAGTDGTVSRHFMGALPAAGQWVRLAVPASSVGLEGQTLTGMAFTLYGGRATWDQAGK